MKRYPVYGLTENTYDQMIKKASPYVQRLYATKDVYGYVNKKDRKQQTKDLGGLGYASFNPKVRRPILVDGVGKDTAEELERIK